jgi:hypothetical protein
VTTVAELLKRERESQAISLEEVAQKTYIKLHYLHALEEDRPDQLPAPVYTCGYIRQYAKLLGLNGADLVNIYQSQHKPREFAIVRNVSPALSPESKIEPRVVAEADEVESIPAAVRHEIPVEVPVFRPAPTISAPPAPEATAPVVAPVITPKPAPVASAPVPAPVAAPLVAPVPRGGSQAPSRPRHEEPAPFNPSLSSAPVPRPQPAVPPSRPAAQAAEPPAPPLEVRIDTRESVLSHPDAEKLLVLARQQADDIISKAREEAARLRQGAEQYADQILAQLESDIGRTLAVIKNGRSHLQSRTRVRRPERASDRAAERSSERSTEATAP